MLQKTSTIWFRPYWEKWGWPVVNGWISAWTVETTSIWPETLHFREGGWVDHQAHGVIHNIPMNDNSTDEYIHSELQGSIDDLQTIFRQDADCHHLARRRIWPAPCASRREARL